MANHGDLEPMERQVMLSHEVAQDGREGEQVQDDRCDLNSNSILDPMDGRPRVSLNGCINSHLVGPTLTASFKGNECDTMMKHGLHGLDVAVTEGQDNYEGF